MKKLFHILLIFSALLSCKSEKTKEVSAEELKLYATHKDMALLSVDQIMVIYYHGYTTAYARRSEAETFTTDWHIDSLYFVERIKPVLIK